MSDFAANDLVLVSPQYLAGGGINKINDVVGPLIHLFSWPYQHDRHSGRIEVDSPCGSVFLDFAPDRQDGMWWTIAHHDPYWQIRFSRQTPSEAIASVTMTLPQLLGDRRHADCIPLATKSVASLAEGRGWNVTATAAGVIWKSPDKHCAVEHSADPYHPWQITHSVHDGLDTHWTATFTPDTPDRLVAQFFTHLASSIPATRVYREVPVIAQTSGSALISPAKVTTANPYSHHAVTQAALAHAQTRQRR
ncbi:DUF317 domain-containing protein [Streptomyces sp. NBC_01259]|uniref:DUF317 domain-containing protein n=1 Tax=Streptomyces sp. NBC_01259 TaxID=2903800 RepID=UPI0032524867